MKPKVLAFVFAFAPALVFASLIFFPADGRKRRDNPADQRGTNYQGYESTNADQSLVVVNLKGLTEGSATVDITNSGWRPESYQFSEDPLFANVSWKTMPSTRLISEAHSGTPGKRTAYVKLRATDKKETTYSLSYTFRSKAIYVDVSLGNDTNAGWTPQMAVSTMTQAYVLAVQSNFSDIYVTANSYGRILGIGATGDGLVVAAPNLRFSGGWNQSFTTQTGQSVLDGQGSPVGRIIRIQSTTNIAFDHFAFNGGKTGVADGGGIFITNSAYVSISNCYLYNNTAGYTGGGLSIVNSHHVGVLAIFEGNMTSALPGSSGGAVCVSNSHSISLVVGMTSNYSQVGAAVSIRGLICTNVTVSGYATTNSNFVNAGAGIVQITDTSGVTISGLSITNNFMSSGIFAVYTAPFQPSLNIRNCVFNTPSPQNAQNYYPIMEGATDITGHSITSNIFLTNVCTNIYRDGGGVLVITTPSFTQMTTANDSYHDAVNVTGNTMSSY